MSNMKGIFPALFTPFDANNKVNEKALAEVMEWHIKSGVSGFYCCGSSAEVFQLTNDERRELMKTIAAINNGRVTLLAHVGSISTDESMALGKMAKDLGYSAVSAVAPFYYKFSLPEIKMYYEEIADASGLPMIVYNIPSLSGVTIPFSYLDSFLCDDRFYGMKHTSNDFFALESLKSRHPDKIFYNGFDEMFLCGMISGADGGIGSTYNFMPDKFVKIYNLYHEGKLEEARAIQHEANDIIRTVIDNNLFPASAALMKMLGFDFGDCRHPFMPCTKEQLKTLETTVLPKLAPKF